MTDIVARQLRNTKIRIKNEDHSRAFQKLVFSLGGGWRNGSGTVKTVIGSFLFVDEDLYLSVHYNGLYFSMDPREEIFFDGENVTFVEGEDSVSVSIEVEQPKPPIGLKPQKVVDQERSLDILAAMTRYVEAGQEVPMSWIEELNDKMEMKRD